MDIYCPRCGEPWDIDSLHDEAAESNRSFSDVRADFAVKGCLALTSFGVRPEDCLRKNNLKTAAASALFDLLGDDVDGIASEMADLGL